MLICLALGITNVWGQAVGTLNGTVLDAAGAVVPGAAVVVTNIETQVENKTTTASPSRSERTATCRPDMCLRSAWAAATGRRRCAMRDREDFVVFSTRTEPKDVQPLELGPTPAVNDAVFAVGNALGQGVVVRNGVYTSDTPEEQSGQWRWLRFSAAAAPGNSGGPLIDQAARVGRGTPRGPFRHPPADPRCERDARGARAIRVTDDSAAVLLKAAEHSRLRSAPRRHGKEVLLPGTDAGSAVHVDN